MKQYNVWQLAIVFDFLKATEVLAGKDGDGPVSRERVEQYYRPSVEYARRQCELIELPAAIVRCDHFLVALRDGLLWSELKNQSRVLREAIQGELKFRRFAFVPTVKATEHDKFGLVWEEIWKQLTDAKEDSQRAIDCYALEQNTACVFHMMRVAEIGLRNIAKKVGVKLIDKGKRQPIEYATWDKVIQGVNAKIIAARALPHGPRKNKNLQFYSQAADQLIYIRDTWRNEVSHTRKSYNDGEAFGVITRVREFMELLAKNKP